MREHMSIVLRKLQGWKLPEFEDLFDTSSGMPVLVVTFIAMLELSKEDLLEVTQAEAFAPIYVRLAYTPISLQFRYFLISLAACMQVPAFSAPEF